MDQNIASRTHDNYPEREDPFSAIKQDFGKIFHEHNLSSFANPSDIGFLDFGKAYYDPYPADMGEHPYIPENEGQQGHRFAGAREELAHHQDSFLNATYSPLRLAHHNPAHYNPALGANYGPGGVNKLPYQQEHGGYPGYHHAQNYYYPGHYDPHMMPGNHEGAVDYYNTQDLMDSHGDEPLSLMWSKETAKTAQQKNAVVNNHSYPDASHRAAAKYPTSGYHASYDQDHEEDVYGSSYGQRNQMIKMQPDMLRTQANMASKSQLGGLGGLNMNPKALDLKDRTGGSLRYPPTRPELNPRKISVGKADNFMDDGDDEDGDDAFGEGKGRSTRGLRVLSLKVKEIVSQKKRTSYKEVAESLTFELRQKMSARSSKEESKDEQNVKRRVYDALNVLIAADVLRKEGKVVYCDESNGFSNNNNNNNNGNKKKSREERDRIVHDIQEAKKKNKQRVEVLHELIFKCLAIKNLIKTNKARLEAEGGQDKKARPSNVNATRIEVVQENPALKPKNEDVIRFPFIVLLSSSPENSMNLNMDTSQRQLAIESKKPFNIFGDIDVLLKMGLHYVPKEIFDQNIPAELTKYVPKYYLAALK